MNKNGCFIIAEIGVNHNGSFKKALKMVKIAKNIGADAVKFQLFDAEKLATKSAPLAKYQKKGSKSPNQLKLLKSLSLNQNEIIKLKKYSDKLGVIFLCSAFDVDSLKFLKNLNLKYFKVPSGEINNFPYLKVLAKFNRPVLLSTGVSNVLEIRKTVNFLLKNGLKKSNLILLHCNTAYPTPLKDTNLNAINDLKKKFNLQVGFSDHTTIAETPIIAATLGAKFIEKHFTLNNNSKGPDHKASLNPKTFKNMIDGIRLLEKVLGGNKKVTQSEIINKKIIRKSVVAKEKIYKGQKFTENNLTCKRPGFGISPDYFYVLIGKKSKRVYEKDEMIKW